MSKKKFNNIENEKVVLPDGRTIWLSRSVAVVASVVLEKDDQLFVLIEKRGKGASDYQGLFCLPCGYLDKSENSWECFKRETYEETGVDIDLLGENKVSKYPWDIVTDPSENRQNVVIHHIFINTIDKLPDINIINEVEDDEIEEALWIPIMEYKKYDYAFGHRERIEKLIDFLQIK